jgi:hypothetical protein
MRPNIYEASDYCGFEAGKLRVYYGYEQVDPKSEEWCAVIWKNDKEVARYTNSQLLDIACGESPSSMLIAALSLYLSR